MIKIKLLKRPLRKGFTHKMTLPPRTLEDLLLEAINGRVGERGFDEGPVDALYRIIHERDAAFTKLALQAIHPPIL